MRRLIVLLNSTTPAASLPATTSTSQARNDDVEDSHDGVDDGSEDGADAVDDGHQARADGLEDAFDLCAMGLISCCV